MPFDAPFNLGPFAVDAMGRLQPRGAHPLPGFLFRWRGRLVRAHFVQDADKGNRLVLHATLGRVPSTANAREPAQRPQSFELLRLLSTGLPEGWRMLLLPDHRVRLEAEAEVLPITATALVAGLTRFLLALAPYLDVLDEAGIAGELAEAGSANT